MQQVGVEDMEQAVEESRSSVTVRSTATPQRPLGDVNEYDDVEDEDRKDGQLKEVSIAIVLLVIYGASFNMFL